MEGLTPLALGLWPSLFMTATVHFREGSDRFWSDEVSTTSEPFIAEESAPGAPDLVVSLERRSPEHGRLRVFIVPSAPEPTDEAEEASVDHSHNESDADEDEQAVRTLEVDDLLGRVAEACVPASVTFDCVSTTFLDTARFRTTIPLPVRLWAATDSVFGEMVGARFAYQRRGLQESWIAVDLLEKDDLRVQVHFTKRLRVTRSSILTAWNEVLYAARKAVAAQPQQEASP